MSILDQFKIANAFVGVETTKLSQILRGQDYSFKFILNVNQVQTHYMFSLVHFTVEQTQICS